MVEKGRRHEMKLVMASTGTALPLWAFKVPSRKIPYVSSCANLMMWAHLRGRTGPKARGERTTESNRDVNNNQVWFLHENVLTKPIISYVNNNACFGDHSACDHVLRANSCNHYPFISSMSFFMCLVYEITHIPRLQILSQGSEPLNR